jgi:hypothetical protein
LGIAPGTSRQIGKPSDLETMANMAWRGLI